MRNVNCYSKHQLNPDQKLEGQKNSIKSIVLLLTHPSIPQTPSSTSKTMQQSKTDEIVFFRDNGLSQSTWIWSSAFEHMWQAQISFKRRWQRVCMQIFSTLFSHKTQHLLFKNSATSVFLIQINTVHLKQSKSLCRTAFVMLLPSEPLN